MTKHVGGVAEYRSSEGKSVMLPYRGPIDETIKVMARIALPHNHFTDCAAARKQDILGGIRSTCTYVGASHLKEISKRTTFIRVTQQINQVLLGHIP